MSEESQQENLELAVKDEPLPEDAIAVLDGEVLPEEQPEIIVVDHSKLFVWIADSGNDRIQKFDGNGKFLFAFGRSGGTRCDQSSIFCQQPPLNYKYTAPRYAGNIYF